MAPGDGHSELRPDRLPDDPAVLKQIIVQLVEDYHQVKRQNEKLLHHLAKLQRWAFGSRSETIPEEQMIFPFVEAIDVRALPEQAEPVRPKAQPRPASDSDKKGHGRRIIPPDLPRRREVIDVSKESRICPDCGESLVQIGEEISEELDLEPEKLFVRQRARPKYACRPCQNNVTIAALPERIIERGLAGPGLLAAIMVGKYADHAPLYRQEQMLARHGIEISRSTMCGWIGQVTDQLGPLYKAMREDVLKSGRLNSDDTPMPVLEPGLGKTRTARFWTYRADQPEHRHTVYEYTPDRKQDHVKQFLTDFAGSLQCDAYAGYKSVESEDVVLVGCWAHARRYFFDAQPNDQERALIGMGYIRRLYEIEWEADEKSLDPEGRKELRQKYSVPLLQAFKLWLNDQLPAVLPKSPIGEAIGYALGQWQTLIRYAEDGRIPIDNNSAERALKPIVIGRKNYLFMGSDEGGRRAAIAYTLIQSCKDNDVEPWAYLRDIFERLPSHPMKRILDLAPCNWKKRRGEQTSPPDTS